MGLLNPRPKLEPGEHLLWRKLANHVDGPSYVFLGLKSASGGQLIVTDRRIFFQPSRLDRATGSGRWEHPIDAVTGLEDVAKERIEITSGGMRKRLGIRTADGVEVFVVNKLDKTMAELGRLLPGA